MGLAAFVALLFLARTLVPVGYMVAVGPQGDLSLALCSGYVPAAPSPHGEHHHHGAGSGSGAGGQDARHDPCPFALAGSTALARALPALPQVIVRHEPRLRFDESVSFPRRFSGAHGARAPPALS